MRSGQALRAQQRADGLGSPAAEAAPPWLERTDLLSIIDAVSEAVAVIDEAGVIRLVNRAWREFSIANGTSAGQPAACTGEGTSYLQICEAAAACRSEGSQAALDGIRAVLAGTMPSFSLEYPCHSADRQRWFSMRAAPLGPAPRGAVITHVDVTDIRVAAQAAQAAQQQFASMIAAVPGVIYQFLRAPDGTWRFLHVSAGVEELFEKTPEAALADHAALTDCILTEDRAAHRAAVEDSARNLTPWVHEHRIRTPGGRLKWLRGQASPRRLDDGSVLWNGILVDITGRKQTESDLVECEQRWKFALEGAGDGVWDWNLNTGQALFSTRWKNMFGYAESEIGQEATEWSSRVHPDDMPGVMRDLEAHLAGKTPSVEVEFRMRRKDGQWCWTLGRGMLVSRDRQGRPVRLVGTNTDITERKRLEARLHELAFHDALTRLPNRRLLIDRLSHAVAASQRTGRRGALMFLDLDNFKSLNDTAGHAVGDRLLIEVARRLKHNVREMDTVARLGGDEFVVMISDLHVPRADAAEHALRIARKIRQTLSEPYRLTEPADGQPEATVLHHCTASIGLALFGTETTTVDALLSSADRAMYQAKADGANSIRLAGEAAGPQ